MLRASEGSGVEKPQLRRAGLGAGASVIGQSREGSGTLPQLRAHLELEFLRNRNRGFPPGRGGTCLCPHPMANAHPLTLTSPALASFYLSSWAVGEDVALFVSFLSGTQQSPETQGKGLCLQATPWSGIARYSPAWVSGSGHLS